MASKEQLRKIAIYCDSYNPKEDDSLNMTSKYMRKNMKAVKIVPILLKKVNVM